jgi:hypothetical protein
MEVCAFPQLLFNMYDDIKHETVTTISYNLISMQLSIKLFWKGNNPFVQINFASIVNHTMSERSK